MDRQPVTAFLGGEIGVLGKCREERRFRRRDQALVQGDAVEQADDALGARTQIVERIGAERDAADRTNAARAILTLEVPLQHEPVVPENDEPMHIPDALFGDGLVEPRRKVGGKARVRRLGERPCARLRE